MSDKLLILLREAAEEGYRSFTAKLIPNLDEKRLLGVRMPVLKQLLRTEGEYLHSEEFLHHLPHRYHEQDLLHALVLAEETEFSRLAEGLRRFLPHVTNWAVCDSLRPKLFSRHPAEAPSFLRELLVSPHPYACRFAMEMLMLHYLNDSFDEKYFSWVAEQKREDYYVKMMQAWYFSTALACRFSLCFSYLKTHPLSPWVQNKAIQKARESLRLSDRQKEQLFCLKLPNQT